MAAQQAALACVFEKEGEAGLERKKRMEGLMDFVIENPTGQATMTDLYEIMEHAAKCERCNLRFNKLTRKAREQD